MIESDHNPRPATCPSCGAREIVPIAYGLPSIQLMEEGRAGKIALGGCSPAHERWYCKACQSSFE